MAEDSTDRINRRRVLQLYRRNFSLGVGSATDLDSGTRGAPIRVFRQYTGLAMMGVGGIVLVVCLFYGACMAIRYHWSKR
jgi:hypothetical protein